MGRKIAILRDLDLEVGHDPDPDHVGVQDPNPNQGLDQSQDPGQNLDLGPEDLDPNLDQGPSPSLDPNQGPDHVLDQSHVQRITKVDLDHDPDLDLDLDPDLAQNRHLKKLIVKPLDQDLAQSQKKMKKLMMQKPMMMVIMTKWC